MRPARYYQPKAPLPSAGGYTTAIIGTERGVVHYAVFDPAGGQCGFIRRGKAAWCSWRELEGETYREKSAPVRDCEDALTFLSRVITDGRARAWFEFQHGRQPVPFGGQAAFV